MHKFRTQQIVKERPQPPFRIGKDGCIYEGNEENEKEELI